VAVSGGVDSMVLLRLLHVLAPKYGWKLAVAHFNHQLRGRSSDADERLVRQTAKNLGLPFVGGRGNVRRFSRVNKLSLEMGARRLRHGFLARAAAGLKSGSIALAHHADDQVELFFLRIFRGSGGEGVSGMKWRNASPGNPRLSLVRPLLDVSKSELEAFARDNKTAFRQDASNLRLDIRRNRIRRELLPLLRRDYQPALDRVVLRLMDIAGAEAEFVGQAARAWLKNRAAPAPGFSKARGRVRFDELPAAVQRRCIQLQLLKRGIPAQYDLVEQLRCSPGKAVATTPELDAVLTARGELRLRRAGTVSRSGFKRSTKKGRVRLDAKQGSIVFGGLEIRWNIVSRKPSVPPARKAGRELFDADAVGPDVILRHWQPGDRFQPIGMSSPVKLQDLFTNDKIPREQRHDLVVVTTRAGHLVWVENLRISERFKLSESTIRHLQWRWKRL
jgi:tRNA(Ile)-lysidine synthase